MIDKIFRQQINEAIFDSSVASALENPRVLNEASIRTNVGRKIVDFANKTKLPESIKSNLRNNPKATASVAFLLSTAAILKLSASIYKLYLNNSYPRCKKYRNEQARKECIIQCKIQSKQKTILHLKSLKSKAKNKDRVSEEIKKLQSEIRKLRKKSLKLDWEF
jgi:hypothetical protein